MYTSGLSLCAFGEGQSRFPLHSPAVASQHIWTRTHTSPFSYLHCRLCLFRPMLARLCFSHVPASTEVSSFDHEGLRHRAMKDGASLCVDTAQAMIDVVQSNQNPGEPFGLFCWWHRVFYLHTASTILIAAMLRADLFAPMVLPAWNKAMVALRAHEHLSPSCQQYVATFQSIASRIMDTQQQPPGEGQSLAMDGLPNAYFQDFIHDLGLESDNLFFGTEDTSWLNYQVE